MRTLALGGGLLLVSTFLSACGGGGSPAGEASEEEFCTAYNTLYDNLGDIASGDDEAAIEGMKEWGEKMSEVGTPDDISDEEREGFELLLTALEDVDPDASAEELKQIGEDFSSDDENAIEAFTAYAVKTCPPDLGDIDMPDMSDEMSDLESEMGELTESP